MNETKEGEFDFVIDLLHEFEEKRNRNFGANPDVPDAENTIKKLEVFWFHKALKSAWMIFISRGNPETLQSLISKQEEPIPSMIEYRGIETWN